MWKPKGKVCNLGIKLRILHSQIAAQKKLWISCGILEMIAVFLNLEATYKKYTTGYGVIPCKADYFVWENGLYAKLFYIVPITLLLFMKDSKEMEGEQLLIRKHGKKAIWYEMVFHIVVISLLLAMLQLFTVLTYAAFNPADNMNWDQKRSVFWLITGGKVLRQDTVSYAQVIFGFFILEYLSAFITGIIYLLCNIFIRNRIIPWVICLGMIMVDQGISTPIFIYGKLSLDYPSWLNLNFIETGIVSGMVGVIGVILGRYLIERKEYYGK